MQEAYKVLKYILNDLTKIIIKKNKQNKNIKD